MNDNFIRDVKKIYNDFAKAYSVFEQSKDMRTYQETVDGIIERYAGDAFLCPFCKNLAFAWCAVVNKTGGAI